MYFLQQALLEHPVARRVSMLFSCCGVVTASSFCVCSHMMPCLRLLLSLPTAFASAHALCGRSTDSPQSHEESREGCRGKRHPVTFRLCCGSWLLSPGCRGNLHVSLLGLTLAQGDTSVSYNQPTNLFLGKLGLENPKPLSPKP